jgi:anti-sigma B factor antagonist
LASSLQYTEAKPHPTGFYQNPSPQAKETAMTIKEELKDNIAILKITGELMSFPEVSPFHDHIKKLVADGTNQIIVDFSSIKWFGSAMLGTLTASLVTAKEAGGDLRLVGITKRIESILMVTSLASAFQTFRTANRALVSFKHAAKE